MSVFVYAGVGKGPPAPKKGDDGAQSARQPVWMLALVSQAEAAVLAEGADCKSRPKAQTASPAQRRDPWSG